MTTTSEYNDVKDRPSLFKAKEMTKDVPKRRRFAVIYSEWDNSLCVAEGEPERTAASVLNIAKFRWEGQREKAAEWMAKCDKGSIFLTGGGAAIVRTK